LKVHLRIERLVLDGVELTRSERAALAPAIQRALSDRLGGGPAPRADRPTARVEHLGGQIANAVHDHVPGTGGAVR